MIKKLLAFSILLMMFSCCVEITPTEDYPTLTGYVNDFADLLTSEEEAKLTQMIEDLERDTGVEIAIVTVKTTQGEDRTLYANHIGDKNGVGKEETDNGIVILWSISNDDGGAIATGRGIESTLNDAKVTRIGRASRTYFDKNQYYDGFNYILVEINKEINPNYEAPKTEDLEVPSIPLLLIIGLVLLILILFLSLALALMAVQASEASGGAIDGEVMTVQASEEEASAEEEENSNEVDNMYEYDLKKTVKDLMTTHNLTGDELLRQIKKAIEEIEDEEKRSHRYDDTDDDNTPHRFGHFGGFGGGGFGGFGGGSFGGGGGKF